MSGAAIADSQTALEVAIETGSLFRQHGGEEGKSRCSGRLRRSRRGLREVNEPRHIRPCRFVL
jgi:hypothetical protein